MSPGITGRYEVFYDETCKGVRVWLLYHLYSVHAYREQEHECRVEFKPQAASGL